MLDGILRAQIQIAGKGKDQDMDGARILGADGPEAPGPYQHSGEGFRSVIRALSL